MAACASERVEVCSWSVLHDIHADSNLRPDLRSERLDAHVHAHKRQPGLETAVGAVGNSGLLPLISAKQKVLLRLSPERRAGAACW